MRVRCSQAFRLLSGLCLCTVRSGAGERTSSGARLGLLIFRLSSHHVLNHVHCRRQSAKISQIHDVFNHQANPHVHQQYVFWQRRFTI